MPNHLWTARYNNGALKLADHSKVCVYGITLGNPRFKLAYKLVKNLRVLGPPKSLWGQSKEAFAAAYESYLNDRSEAVRETIDSAIKCAAGNHVVFCCFEDLRDPTKHCHRTTLAKWIAAVWCEPVVELPEEIDAAAAAGFTVAAVKTEVQGLLL